MTTEGDESFNAEAESVEQTGITSELKAVESDDDLHRKRLLFRIFSKNLKGNTMIDTPRSCSVNGTCSRETPLTISLPRETKAAFEHSTLLHEIQAVGKEKSDDGLSSPRITDHMTQAADTPSHMATASVEKNNFREESGAFTTTTPESEDGNKPQALFSDAFFTPRSSGQERTQYVLRDKRKSLAVVLTDINSTTSTQSIDNIEARKLKSQSPTEFNAQQKDTEEILREAHLDEHNKMSGKETVIKNGKATIRNKYTGKETTKIREQLSNDSEKIGEDTEEQSDAIIPLATPLFSQSQINWRQRSSTASMQHFPATPPSGQTSTSRSRRVSIADTPHFPTPSTSGQADTSRALREAAMKLPTQSSAEISDVTETRRDSRRRSSVAASMLSSDTRDGKKGSIGFTLAASLVKWKMNSLKEAKKANKTIAKNAKHQEFMDRTADRIKTELPRPLLVSIQEEAYPIILRTAQAYRSQLGAKHKLTIQAYDRLADLIRDLNSPY